MTEIKAIGTELGLDLKAVRKKDELIDLVFAAKIKSEGFIDVAGILDVLPEGYGFLRTSGYLPGDRDVYVSQSQVRRFGLRRGDLRRGPDAARQGRREVRGAHARGPRQRPGPGARRGSAATSRTSRRSTRTSACASSAPPRTRSAGSSTSSRPSAKASAGSSCRRPRRARRRSSRTSPTRSRRTTPRCYVICLLVDERPEEVTDMERSIRGEVVSSTFDMPSDNHIAVAELVLERAKRMVRERLRRRDPARLDHPSGARLQPGAAGVAAASSPAAWTPRRCTRPSGSSARRATSSTAARSRSSRRRSWTPAPRWTRSSSRSSRAPGTWSCAWTAAWRTSASSRPSTSSRRAPARRSSSSTRSRRPTSGRLRRRLHSAEGDQQTEQVTEQLIRLLKQTKSNREMLATLAKAGASGRDNNGG